MKWEGHEESENVEDRRGISGKQMAVGGGVGALVLLLVAAFLGVDPQKLNQLVGNAPGGAGAATSARTPSHHGGTTRQEVCRHHPALHRGGVG